MSLKARITEDMKSAMKAKEAGKLAAIRLLLAAVKQKEVDERVELDDAAVGAVIEKLVKQRKDSVTQYEAANRQDLADVEKAEIAILAAYLPEKMGNDEIAAAVAAAVAETGAKGPADMGKLMAVLKPATGRQGRHGGSLQARQGRTGQGIASAGRLRRSRRPAAPRGAKYLNDAPMIPDSFIQDLLARVDIVDLVDGYVPLKKAGANYAACCPFHNEKSPSFTVSPTKQFYHCFGCGAHGTAISFVMEYQGLGFVDAVKDLATRAGMQVPESEGRSFNDEKQGQTRTLIEVMARAAQYYKDQLKRSPKGHRVLQETRPERRNRRPLRHGLRPGGLAEPAGSLSELQRRRTEGRRPGHRKRSRPPLRPLPRPADDPDHQPERRDHRLRWPHHRPGRTEIPEFAGNAALRKGRELFGLPQARQALRETDTAIVTEGYMDVIAWPRTGSATRWRHWARPPPRPM